MLLLRLKGFFLSRSDVKQKKQWNVLCAVASVLFLGLLGDLVNSRAVCMSVMYCPLVFRAGFWHGYDMA